MYTSLEDIKPSLAKELKIGDKTKYLDADIA